MCTKKKLEWIQVTETFTSLRVCACGCICVNIYMYTCGRHTPIQWTFLKSICMLTSRADVCVKTESLPPSPAIYFVPVKGDSVHKFDEYADDVTLMILICSSSLNFALSVTGSIA